MSPKTWESVRIGWVAILDSLKSLLETGEPLPSVDTGDRAGHDVRSTASGTGCKVSTPTTAPGSCSTAVSSTDDEARRSARPCLCLDLSLAPCRRGDGGQRRPAGHGSCRAAMLCSARASWRCIMPGGTGAHVAGGRRPRRRLRSRLRPRGDGTSARLPRSARRGTRRVGARRRGRDRRPRGPSDHRVRPQVGALVRAAKPERRWRTVVA